VFDSKKGLEISFSISISRADLSEREAYINVLKFQLFLFYFVGRILLKTPTNRRIHASRDEASAHIEPVLVVCMAT
jgi:hypothetical protein